MCENDKPRHDRIIPAYTGLELYALSLLMNDWAQKHRHNPKPLVRLRRQIPQLRKGVIAGCGRRELVPSELVQCDFRATLVVVTQLRKKLERSQSPSMCNGCDKVVYPTGRRGGAHRFTRHVIWELEFLGDIEKRLKDHRSDDRSIAGIIVSTRLAIDRKTLSAAIRDRARSTLVPSADGVDDDKEASLTRARERPTEPVRGTRLRPKPLWDLAISVLVDSVVVRNDAWARKSQAQILDALLGSGLPPIVLFYLVQVMQTLPTPQGLCAEEEYDVKPLCEALCPKAPPVFSSLLHEE